MEKRIPQFLEETHALKPPRSDSFPGRSIVSRPVMLITRGSVLAQHLGSFLLHSFGETQHLKTFSFKKKKIK